MHGVTLVCFFFFLASTQVFQAESCTSEVRDVVVLLEHGQSAGVQGEGLWGTSTTTTGQERRVSGTTLDGISTRSVHGKRVGIPGLRSVPTALELL